MQKKKRHNLESYSLNSFIFIQRIPAGGVGGGEINVNVNKFCALALVGG